jgi:hypothetical protein
LHLDPFLYLFDNYIWYLRTVNSRLISEDIFVVPEKLGERELLFCREVDTDSHRLGRTTDAHVDLLDVGFFRWCKVAGPLSRNL